MEFVDNELRWVYKDFNFYPNKMRYGFRVNSFDIADVHSRFVKFICLRDCIIKQFPYVSIQHKIFIFRKFDENLRLMMNRLTQVKVLMDPQEAPVAAKDENVVSSSTVPMMTSVGVGNGGHSIDIGGDHVGVRFRKERVNGGGGGGPDYVSRQFKPNYHRPDPLPMNRRATPNPSLYSNRPLPPRPRGNNNNNNFRN